DRTAPGPQTRLIEVLHAEPDIRLIAACRRDLAAEVAAERFRDDLYWCLNVLPIQLPPLRDRREDIPTMVALFLEHFSHANQRRVDRVHPDAMLALQSYSWPANTGELRSYVERAVVMADRDE